MTEIDKVVKQVVQKQFAPAKIVDLTVKEAEDSDGDPILRIKVIYKAKDDRLDPERVLGLIRHLREPLIKLGSDRFPIVSFMTSEEAADAAA
ncbi:MAG: hypothetical protein OXF74_04735 [Rhodobacteraceae bacterium]|nr:hypothetical protein [Paracoccaceae bacterium]